MNDFEALFIEIAKEKGFVSADSLRKYRSLIQSPPGGASLSHLFVKLGLLDWNQCIEVLRLQKEAVARGRRPPPDVFQESVVSAQGDAPPSATSAPPPPQPAVGNTLELRASEIFDARRVVAPPPAGARPASEMPAADRNATILMPARDDARGTARQVSTRPTGSTPAPLRPPIADANLSVVMPAVEKRQAPPPPAVQKPPSPRDPNLTMEMSGKDLLASVRKPAAQPPGPPPPADSNRTMEMSGKDLFAALPVRPAPVPPLIPVATTILLPKREEPRPAPAAVPTPSAPASPAAAPADEEKKRAKPSGFPYAEGDEVAGCRLIRRLPGSGLARVFFAERLDNGNQVAIKLVPLENLPDEAPFRRFEVDVQAASRADHPGFVRVSRSGRTKGVHFIEMEYLPGDDLAALIKRERLGWSDALRLMRQAASALDAIAVQGVVHRDIKPSNLFLASNGDLKIADIGFAHIANYASLRGFMSGLPFYMAPEQWAGDEADARSDQYGLAAVVYELIAGRPPVEGRTHMELGRNMAAQGPTPIEHHRPDLPLWVAAIINRALSKAPDARFPNWQELIGTIDNGAAPPRPPSSHQVSAPPPTQLPADAPPAALFSVLAADPEPEIPTLAPPQTMILAPVRTARRTLLWVSVIALTFLLVFSLILFITYLIDQDAVNGLIDAVRGLF
jgi:hypothetical protein